jgi:hypothetical protein
MSLHQDWEGIAQEKIRAWEAEVHKRQLRAYLPRRRAAWRRRAGSWLMRLGEWLTHQGAQMAECEFSQRASALG